MSENSMPVPSQLRFYLNLATLEDLPAWSKAPRGDTATVATALRSAGFHGVQAEDAREYGRYGLGFATLGRANTIEEIRGVVTRWAAEGHQCGTLHIGWGFEEDSEVFALARAVVQSSRDEGIPIYIETHRATITQDPWRTLKLVEAVPEVRFNGDFSHWYTGSEMTYGDIGHKMDLISPVFERVRFLHARVGNSGAMQVPLADPTMAEAMEHFREMWTRSMVGFLNDTEPEDTLIFSPELLRSSINYARRFQSTDGSWQEDSDRWTDSLALLGEATACFQEAERRTKEVTSGVGTRSR
jgi:hypothetical protein